MNKENKTVTVEDFNSQAAATYFGRILTKQEALKAENELVVFEFMHLMGGRVMFFASHSNFGTGLLPEECASITYTIPFKMRDARGDMTYMEADELVLYITDSSKSETVHCLESVRELVQFINRGSVAEQVIEEDALERASLPGPVRQRVTRQRTGRVQFERINFNCSHCGTSIYRVVTLAALESEHDTTLFCSHKCANQNRMSGLTKLTAERRNKIMDLHRDAYSAREIATIINASPQAVDALLFQYKQKALAENRHLAVPVMMVRGAGGRPNSKPAPLREPKPPRSK